MCVRYKDVGGDWESERDKVRAREKKKRAGEWELRSQGHKRQAYILLYNHVCGLLVLGYFLHFVFTILYTFIFMYSIKLCFDFSLSPWWFFLSLYIRVRVCVWVHCIVLSYSVSLLFLPVFACFFSGRVVHFHLFFLQMKQYIFILALFRLHLFFFVIVPFLFFSIIFAVLL